MQTSPYSPGDLVELTRPIANAQTNTIYPAGMLARVKTLHPGGALAGIEILGGAAESGWTVLDTPFVPLSAIRPITGVA